MIEVAAPHIAVWLRAECWFTVRVLSALGAPIYHVAATYGAGRIVQPVEVVSDDVEVDLGATCQLLGFVRAKTSTHGRGRPRQVGRAVGGRS